MGRAVCPDLCRLDVPEGRDLAEDAIVRSESWRDRKLFTRML